MILDFLTWFVFRTLYHKPVIIKKRMTLGYLVKVLFLLSSGKFTQLQREIRTKYIIGNYGKRLIKVERRSVLFHPNVTRRGKLTTPLKPVTIHSPSFYTV